MSRGASVGPVSQNTYTWALSAAGTSSQLDDLGLPNGSSGLQRQESQGNQAEAALPFMT